MSKMKVEILFKDTIKPSSLTSHRLKTVELSFIDEKMAPVFVGGLFFYNYNGADKAEISGKLKNSLSETLTCFYPLTGRINDKVIECNDEGALFIEARASVLLSDLLVNPDPLTLVALMPSRSPKAELWPLLLVQVTFFSCGGFVLGVLIPHIVADVTTVSIFLRGWAATARGHGDMVTPNYLSSSMIFPRLPHQEPYPMPKDERNHVTTKKPEFVTKRFVFEADKINLLKVRAASEQVKDPTRFESIVGLLWCCLTRATRSDNGVQKPSSVQFPVNIRNTNISPILSENSMGNIVLSVSVDTDGSETGLEQMVRKLRDNKEKTLEKFRTMEAMKFAEEYEKQRWDFMCRMISGAIDGHIFTSWARTGFYEVDLGFGNPNWVTANNLNWEFEVFILMDTENGRGIEVWVSLMNDKMSALEEDHELLQFATPNPSVV
ncbi:PREDICTED: BAHD acyltransferase At5g47980-like [Tarenaya hassleriana]|uniref:BAHD acyltransferase At5g47980-like n=1 Tax=Tarenaya hassleriana TaxID=28532 RepID=UPI00053C322A|nr:PREDICTED: BAHD acyltransferase At5g47980-like [Tarenaya hassleriana]